MKLSLLSLTSLSVLIAATNASKPSPEAVLASSGATPADPSSSVTDSSLIASTAQNVDQTSSVPSNTPPSQSVASTTVTATDGDIASNATASRRSLAPESWIPRQNKGNVVLASRSNADYVQVFGPATNGPDASIQGTAYLTYRLVSNSTYNIDACLNACSSTAGCVFANLYYEYNNPLYDWVFGEKSNLACALYGDIHTAAEKTNFGGQQQKPLPEPLTQIRQSTGWALRAFPTPDTPAGYSPASGPLNAANEAPAYMGFNFISSYDPQACADLCASRGADPVFGQCQAFNIWRAVVAGIPTTYTCSFYGLPLDSSTSTNKGQGDLKVTYSRMYNRQNLLINGGFEGNAANDWAMTGNFIYFGTDSSLAHSGTGYAANGDTNRPFQGSFTSKHPLATVPGKTYQIQFWYQNFNGPMQFSVRWNGQTVGTDIVNGPTTGGSWTLMKYTSPPASGNDVLSFFGGNLPSYWYIDDVSVFA